MGGGNTPRKKKICDNFFLDIQRERKERKYIYKQRGNRPLDPSGVEHAVVTLRWPATFVVVVAAEGLLFTGKKNGYYLLSAGYIWPTTLNFFYQPHMFKKHLENKQLLR